MANSNDDKFRRFHHALIQSPEYFGLPTKDRKACTNFASLAARLDSISPPGQDELESALGPALQEARKLATQGLLTVDLAELGPMSVSETAQETSEKSDPGDPLSKYSIHPAAAVFPLMDEDALNKLADDIRRAGLRQPIVMHKQQVLDGRNRIIGCFRAGVEPTVVEWSGTGSVVEWIISTNIHRRHLTDQQRSVIAAKLAQELAIEGRRRSVQNLRNSGAPVEKRDPVSRTGSSAEEAAKLLGVSKDSVTKAARVLKAGNAQLEGAVSRGDVSLDAASLISSLPNHSQDELLNKGKDTVQKAAKKLREEKKSERSKFNKSRVEASKAEVTTMTAERLEPESNEVAVESVTLEPGIAAANEGIPLVGKLHESIEGLVSAARIVGKVDRLEYVLQNLIDYADRFRAKFARITSV